MEEKKLGWWFIANTNGGGGGGSSITYPQNTQILAIDQNYVTSCEVIADNSFEVTLADGRQGSLYIETDAETEFSDFIFLDYDTEERFIVNNVALSLNLNANSQLGPSAEEIISYITNY